LKVQLRSEERVRDQKDRKTHDVAGEVGSGSGPSTRESTQIIGIRNKMGEMEKTGNGNQKEKEKEVNR